MSVYDLGDVVPLAVNVRDAAGDLANATAVTVTVTLPDGTTSGALTPTNSATGVYTYNYTPATLGRYGVRWVATGDNASAFTDVFTVLDPAELPVVGLAEAKRYLRRTDTTDDEDIRRTLGVATELCERHTGRTFRRATVVEVHDGGDYARRSAIPLRAYPVLSVSSVTENGVALSASDYFLDATKGQLVRGSTTAHYTWALGQQNISVSLVAGYADPPAVAHEAVLVTLEHLWENRQQAIRPAFGGGEADVYAPGGAFALPRRAEQLLDTLRVQGIG